MMPYVYSFTSARLRVFIALLGSLLLSLPAVAQGNQGLVPDTTEARVLRQFYAATGGDTWYNRTNWNQGTTAADFSTWAGVFVRNGDVQELNFYNNHLQGSLPASLVALTELRRLYLPDNQLTGNLPPAWSAFPHLEMLFLAGNGLSGPIPAWLGTMTSLQHLELRHNAFSGSVPASLGQLVNLHHLVLNNNQLSGPLPAGLGQLTRLQYLHLSYNQFSGTLPADLGNCLALHDLNLAYNQFSGPLPSSWNQFTQLGYVNLQGNQLSGALPPGWGNCGGLIQLSMAANRFTGPLPESWGQLGGLQVLDLSGNQLLGPVPASWRTMGSLRQLFLSHNQLSGTLPPELGQLGGLNYLDLDHNRFSGSLPRAFNRLRGLYRLSGAYNQLSGPVPDSLQATFLNLDHNHFAGALPATLGFYQLTLNNNDLTTIPDYGVPLGYGGPLEVYVGNNYLDFGSLEPNETILPWPGQRTPGPADTVYALHGSTVTRTRTMAGTANHYQWQRLVNQVWVNVPDQTTATLTLPAFDAFAEGEYRAQVTNDLVYGVTLYTRSLYVSLLPYTPLPFNEPVADNCPTVRDAAPDRHIGDPDPVNYVRTYTARAPYTDPALLRQAPVQDVQVKTEYVDGLGRPVQTVVRQESPLGRDIIQPITYDALGRSPRQYLPYTVPSAPLTGASDYRDHALAEQYAFHHGPGTGVDPAALSVIGTATTGLPKTGVPFAETAFEPSPLNRPRLQGSPGESWQLSSGHAQQLAERPNGSADAVRRWQPGYGPNREDLTPQPAYAAGELWVKRSTDEQGQVREEFTDKEGRVVLMQVATAPITGAGGTICALASEGGTLTLTAPAGMVLTGIQRATYGAATGTDCATLNFTCSGDVTPIMQQVLLAAISSGPAQSVSLSATNWALQDPCYGYYKTLQVVATYAPAPTPAQWLRTYYVYDDFGRLRAVVPPLAVERILVTTGGAVDGAGVERLLFRYHYDEQGRLVEKKVPDTDGYAYTIYDELDRPILTQDVAQRARGEWVATHYDALGRVVYTALAHFPGVSGTPDQIRTTLQQRATEAATRTSPAPTPLWEAPSSGLTLGRAHYTHAAFPYLDAAKDALLSIAYYDDYDFDENGTAEASYSAPTAAELNCAPGEVPVVDLRVTGQATRSEVRVLGVEANTPGDWLVSTTFFDEKLRPIQVQSLNAREREDIVTTRYDFTGKALASYAVHHGPNGPVAGLSVREQHRYDHAGRLQITTQELAGATPQVITRLRYNELGQVEQKLLGGTLASIGGAPVTPPAPNVGPVALQTVDYRYNIRGWLTDLNDVQNPDPQDLWSLSLRYNCGFNTPQFNGNIAGQTWRSASDGIERAYGYRYDNLSRLLQGDFVARSSAIPTASWSAERSNYRFWAASYDAGGNLLTLRRRGLVQPASRMVAAQYAETDNLRYNYTPATTVEPVSNRLKRVDDRAPLTTAFGAKVPERPDFSDGATSGSTQPDYSYDAAGSLTADRNKNITRIQYNYLHLPQHIEWGNGDSLVYRYTASGQKVTKLAYTHGQPAPVRTDYLGAWQYEKDSLRWLSTSEGRALALYSLDPAGQRQLRYAYEYTLKDHLGNLRVAFRPGERASILATLEPGLARRETQQFDSLSISYPIARPTSLAHMSQHAAVLNSAGSATVAPTPLGPMAQLAVAKGDTVDVEAYARYETAPSSNNWNFSLLGFVAGLLQQQPAPTATGPDGTRRRVLPLLNIGLAAGAGMIPPLFQINGVPQAYLRLLVFDKDSVLIGTQTQLVSATARTSYQKLEVSVIVSQGGYVMAYVANESDVDVAFDNVRVMHRQGLQVQENHYDPYGLDLAGVSRQAPGLKELNQYSWNGKEKQAEFGLNWHDHGWRFFDPQLGRWVVVDPDAEEADQESWTTYQFGLDNAVRFNDLDGRAPGGPGDGMYGTGIDPAFPTRALVTTILSAGNSLFNFAATTSAIISGDSYKFQAGFKRDGGGNEILESEIRIVPREGAMREGVGMVLDGLAIAAAAEGGSNPTGLVMGKAGSKSQAVQEISTVVRRGKSWESTTRLAKQAEAAENAGFGHGVSVTSPEGNVRLAKRLGQDPADAVSATSSSISDAGFKLNPTPTKHDPTHHTLILPKPVTPESAKSFNTVFGRTK